MHRFRFSVRTIGPILCGPLAAAIVLTDLPPPGPRQALVPVRARRSNRRSLRATRSAPTPHQGPGEARHRPRPPLRLDRGQAHEDQPPSPRHRWRWPLGLGRAEADEDEPPQGRQRRGRLRRRRGGRRPIEPARPGEHPGCAARIAGARSRPGRNRSATAGPRVWAG